MWTKAARKRAIMPLLDHFRAPLYPRRRWESFHSYWCAALGAQLNRLLGPRFFADVHIHLGREVEADVAEFERDEANLAVQGNGAGGLALATYAPPTVTHTIATIYPDDI